MPNGKNIKGTKCPHINAKTFKKGQTQEEMICKSCFLQETK